MPYLGNTPTTQSFTPGTDYFNGTGSQTVFTLNRPVVSINDIQVVVNNVVQAPNSGYIVSGNTLTFDAAPSAGTNNVYVRYLTTTTQVVAPSTNSVSYASLTPDMQQDIGISFKNRIINGDMRIDQRNNGSSVTVDNSTQFGVDRFFGEDGSDGVFTLQRSTIAPAGFANSLLATVTTADTSLSASQLAIIGQRIEGFNIADLNWGTSNAKTITLSFWVRCSLTGTFGGALWNSAGTRSYPFSYTIGSANTFEYKTITIPGDTTGTWLTDNGRGINVGWSLGVGSDYQATAGSWIGSLDLSATGATSIIGNNGATFYLTGVQFEAGTTATAFDYRSIGTELALCQRYFFTIRASGVPNGENTGITGVGTGGTDLYRTNMALPVTMRAVPTLSVSNNSGVGTDLRAFNGATVHAITALGLQFSNVNFVQADWTMAGTFGVGAYVSVLWRDNATNGWIRVSSEL